MPSRRDLATPVILFLSRVVLIFAVLKILAVTTTPAQFVLFGAYQNIIQILLVFSGSISSYALTQRLHQGENDRDIISNVFILALVFWAIAQIVVYVYISFYSPAIYVAMREQYLAVSLCVFLSSAAIIAQGYDLAKSPHNTYVNRAIAGSFVGLMTFSLFMFTSLEYGLLWAAVGLPMGLLLVSRSTIIKLVLNYRRCILSWRSFLDLLKTGSTNIPILIFPTAFYVLVRSYMIDAETIDYEITSQFEVLWRITAAGAMYFYAFNSAVFFPIFHKPIPREISTIFRIIFLSSWVWMLIIPLFLALVILAFFPEYIIFLIFSENFLVIAPFLFVYCIGDFIRGLSYISLHFFVAKNNPGILWLCEFIFYSLLVMTIVNIELTIASYVTWYTSIASAFFVFIIGLVIWNIKNTKLY